MEMKIRHLLHAQIAFQVNTEMVDRSTRNQLEKLVDDSFQIFGPRPGSVTDPRIREAYRSIIKSSAKTTHTSRRKVTSKSESSAPVSFPRPDVQSNLVGESQHVHALREILVLQHEKFRASSQLNNCSVNLAAAMAKLERTQDDEDSDKRSLPIHSNTPSMEPNDVGLLHTANVPSHSSDLPQSSDLTVGGLSSAATSKAAQSNQAPLHTDSMPTRAVSSPDYGQKTKTIISRSVQVQKKLNPSTPKASDYNQASIHSHHQNNK